MGCRRGPRGGSEGAARRGTELIRGAFVLVPGGAVGLLSDAPRSRPPSSGSETSSLHRLDTPHHHHPPRLTHGCPAASQGPKNTHKSEGGLRALAMQGAES